MIQFTGEGDHPDELFNPSVSGLSSNMTPVTRNRAVTDNPVVIRAANECQLHTQRLSTRPECASLIEEWKTLALRAKAQEAAAAITRLSRHSHDITEQESEAAQKTNEARALLEEQSQAVARLQEGLRAGQAKIQKSMKKEGDIVVRLTRTNTECDTVLQALSPTVQALRSLPDRVDQLAVPALHDLERLVDDQAGQLRLQGVGQASEPSPGGAIEE